MAFFRTKKDDEKQLKAFDGSDFNNMGSADLLQLLLKKLILEGNYNKAENLIFEELEKNKSRVIKDTAIDFYNTLLGKSDEDLISNNFSREEVLQGLEDINSMHFE
ncbi:DUF6483 family protein [Clostridium manihotivorum]|uniref:Uncharacterized protein n=1 Tax=Clostridium manihotivorum TaxID=2320868 RepID=A0A410DVZ6_9CLOT|nr:DUF6483 family protein [Clostridium manihotivorum]QAA33092.1 hypothetical protein C1I91_16415 [Clostridium manihotivorum]